METIKRLLLTNTTVKQTIFKNTFWLLFGEIIGRIFKIILIIYSARVLGVLGWGVFSYTLAFVSIFISFTDIGLNTLVSKELSKDKEKIQYLSTSFYLKIFCLLIASILVLLFQNFFTGKIENAGLSLILFLLGFSFFESLREFLMSINRAREKMEKEAILKIFSNICVSIFGIIFLSINNNPISLALGYATGAGLGVIISFFSLKDYTRKIWLNFDKKLILPILSSAWPLAIVLTMSTLLFNTDTIIIGQIKTQTEVGLYASAQKISFLFHIIPGFFCASILPSLVKSIEDKQKFINLFKKSIGIILGISIIIFLCVTLFSKQIISILYGIEYIQSKKSLQILMISTIPIFLNYIIVYSLIALQKQKKMILSNILAIILNIFLNITLIPSYGIIGAAIATVITISILCILNYLILQKSFKNFNFSYKKQ